MPAGTITTRLAANSSTCTPRREPSRDLQLPTSAPRAGGWNMGPRPTGRDSCTRVLGSAAVLTGPRPVPHPICASAAAHAAAAHGAGYLVTPALRTHPATDTLLRYLSPHIEWTLAQVDERWRDGVRVVNRKHAKKAT